MSGTFSGIKSDLKYSLDYAYEITFGRAVAWAQSVVDGLVAWGWRVIAPWLEILAWFALLVSLLMIGAAIWIIWATTTWVTENSAMYVYSAQYRRHTGGTTGARTFVPVFAFYLHICCQWLAFVGTAVISFSDRPGQNFLGFATEYLYIACYISVAQVVICIPLWCIGFYNNHQRVQKFFWWALRLGKLRAEETPLPSTPDKPTSGTFSSFAESFSAETYRARKHEGRKSSLALFNGRPVDDIDDKEDEEPLRERSAASERIPPSARQPPRARISSSARQPYNVRQQPPP